MFFVRRLIIFLASGLIAYSSFKLNESAISKGNYIQSKWSGKLTFWSIPFYISFLACVAMGVFMIAE